MVSFNPRPAEAEREAAAEILTPPHAERVAEQVNAFYAALDVDLKFDPRTREIANQGALRLTEQYLAYVLRDQQITPPPPSEALTVASIDRMLASTLTGLHMQLTLSDGIAPSILERTKLPALLALLRPTPEAAA